MGHAENLRRVERGFESGMMFRCVARRVFQKLCITYYFSLSSIHPFTHARHAFPLCLDGVTRLVAK